MLSTKEKKEMLQDAGCAKRRDSFRRAQSSVETAASNPSFDAYLKFLTTVHKVFSRVEISSLKSSGKNFKL
ncbi:MAG: hypothetical protein A3D10_02805 [Omnitrophica WOR_2 bacterium RIFCSPHIGHO2_02_FULL_48_11]|nr:MAG: hypothetical protein A3D10_02805 [Omnitrophica WOR_2 bacterium RIFCSPHIGHO2_02_FULL_48_11]